MLLRYAGPPFTFNTHLKRMTKKRKEKIKKSQPLLEIKINQFFLLENIAANLNLIKCYPNPHHLWFACRNSLRKNSSRDQTDRLDSVRYDALHVEIHRVGPDSTNGPALTSCKGQIKKPQCCLVLHRWWGGKEFIYEVQSEVLTLTQVNVERAHSIDFHTPVVAAIKQQGPKTAWNAREWWEK